MNPYIEVYRFRHCFDLGIFRLLKNNGDGTGLFYKEDDLFAAPNPIRKDCRERLYHIKEMKPAYPADLADAIRRLK